MRKKLEREIDNLIENKLFDFKDTVKRIIEDEFKDIQQIRIFTEKGALIPYFYVNIHDLLRAIIDYLGIEVSVKEEKRHIVLTPKKKGN